MKIGIYLFDIINAQYISAGIISLFILTVFAFFVGRRVYNIENDLLKAIEIGNNIKYKNIWISFCFTLIFTEIAYGIVVASFMTVFIFFEDTHHFRTTALILSFTILLEYMGMVSGRIYKRKPLIALPIATILYIFIITWVLFFLRDSNVSSFITYFLIWGFILHIILDISKNITNSLPIIIMTAILSFIGATSYFGKTFYGSIKRELGGGKPIEVNMIMSEDTPPYIKHLFVQDNNVTKKLSILGETNTELLISVASDNVGNITAYRINRSNVKGIVPFKK
jgi:hypothetical protein